MGKKSSPSIKDLRERAFMLIEYLRNLDVVVQRAKNWESEK